MTSSHRHNRKTRIIATLGPVSSSLQEIEALYKAGVDVFRINMSHGSALEKISLISNIRAIEATYGRPIGVLADLQGPKLRVGRFAGDGIILQEGDLFNLDLTDQLGSSSRVSFPHPEIYSSLTKGTELLIDDGKIRLTIEYSSNDLLKARVTQGGKISDNKGVNIPDVMLPLSPITDKDRSDLGIILEEKVDWVALSFVQRKEDILELSELVKGRAALLAKIEKPSAVHNIEEILTVCDAVMVARGDLGVELQLEQVPRAQKKIIAAARKAGCPVVVATQMLESMTLSPIPTRAEVSDVAYAIFEGADAVMLSGESAVGDYGVQAVAVMDRISREVEADPHFIKFQNRDNDEDNYNIAEAISSAARDIGQTVEAKAIVSFTTSGSTALSTAQKRPRVPILALTPNIDVARRLTLVWGLHTVQTEDVDSFESMLDKAKHIAVREGVAKSGDNIVITAGFPFKNSGATNILHIAQIDPD